MAQLPPKIPTMAPAPWPEFGAGHHRRQCSPSAMGMFLAAPTHPQQPSWVDEFLDFSAAKRGVHRRTTSDDYVAFLEPAGPDDGNFDHLDDDQLLSMFSDDLPPQQLAVPAASSPSASDHNSINDEDKTDRCEAEEAQSKCHGDAAAAAATVDPKRVKRILANRQSAQRSRVRKLQYISELERSVTSLQTEVSALSPRVAFLDHQRSLLTLGNSHLKQRIAALAQDKIFKDAHQEALKKEIERLRQIYHQQSLKNAESFPTPDTALVRCCGNDLIVSEGTAAAAPCPPSS
ncbi:unnamed protein product [Urochloa decumbens]|uniref:BZIP domain-containing protein n=1 Tax=Urochloa decumbens TaxID=240449 RepID=A0ABC8YEW1_9POAL